MISGSDKIAIVGILVGVFGLPIGVGGLIITIRTSANSDILCDIPHFKWGCPEPTLKAGKRLSKGERLTSSNKCFTLTLQDDGNLVLYKQNKDNKALWSLYENGASSGILLTGSSLNSSNYADMQVDGNFVLYDANNKAIWTTNTFKSGGSQLRVEEDGNMAIYTPENKIVWQTKTGGQSCR